eukprot:4441682-Pyramimonas_sp.AAC.1
MGPEIPKRGPGEVQDGPKSDQDRHNNVPSELQEATFRVPTEGSKATPPSPLVDGLQDGPRGAPDGSDMA